MSLDLSLVQMTQVKKLQEYKATIAEIGYTVAPGLTAKVTHIDYDYKRGGNTLPSADDNGSATKLTLTASF